MKNVKLLIASLVVFGFFSTTNLNAQEKWGKSGKWEETHTFPCFCAGELLQGTIVFQTNGNGKVTHLTLKGHRLVGIGGFDEEGNEIPSGNEYNFTRVDHYNSIIGSAVWKIRTRRLSDGLVTNTNLYFQDGVLVGIDENCS
jgi:hypothetical protein